MSESIAKVVNLNEPEAEDSEEMEPSVLKIMIEKEEDITKTVSLLKKGIAEHIKPPEVPSGTVERPIKTEFDGLNNLLADQGVKNIIKSVAGANATNLIDKTLLEINLKSKITDKQEAFSKGIKIIQANLSQGKTQLNNPNDPRLNLALSLLGLKKERLL